MNLRLLSMKTMTILPVVGFLVSGVGIALDLGRPAQAATATNLKWMNMGGDYVYNYDFLSKSASRTNVDWPVTIMFIGNATVDKAKSKMEDWSNSGCGLFHDVGCFEYASTGAMYLRMAESQGSTAAWDQDNGKKTPACPASGLSSPHFRVYGIGASERLYNTYYGYWVPATTHRDHNECPPVNRYFDQTEATEQLMIDQTHTKTSARRDVYFWDNSEPYRVEGDHRWNSNAWASSIAIP
jgi:hypothetical protein